jgi:hypothetical protein
MPTPLALKERRKRAATLGRVRAGQLREGHRLIIEALERAGSRGLSVAELQAETVKPLTSLKTECQVLRQCDRIHQAGNNAQARWYIAGCQPMQPEPEGYRPPHPLARVRSVFELGAAL